MWWNNKQIEEQIEAIRVVTAKAMQSKETAIKFLTEAGILKPEPVTKRKRKATIKQAK